MNLSGFIARRYLFAKKSHNVINIISMISAAGIATGCAALVIILSVYNGFDSIVRSLYNSYSPDLVATAVQGKVFEVPEEAVSQIEAVEGVRAVSGVLEENVYVKYGTEDLVAVARGVDSVYQDVTGLRDYIVEGKFSLQKGQINQVVVGRTLALELGLRTHFLTPMEVYFPSRTAEVSLLNPLSSLRKEKLYPSGVVSLEQNFDKKYIYMPIDALRSLLEYDREVSAIEIYVDSTSLAAGGIVSKSMQKRISGILGDGCQVRNRQQQNETVNKLLSYEKIAIYAILLFVMIIISCNIFGSLSMLIIEKRKDIETLKAMGAEDGLIKQVFVREGWLISILGILIGVALGLLICYLQQRFGIVKMPGNFVVDAYPVVVKWSDIALVILGVGAIGYITAAISRKVNYLMEE